MKKKLEEIEDDDLVTQFSMSVVSLEMDIKSLAKKVEVYNELLKVFDPNIHTEVINYVENLIDDIMEEISKLNDESVKCERILSVFKKYNIDTLS